MPIFRSRPIGRFVVGAEWLSVPVSAFKAERRGSLSRPRAELVTEIAILLF